MKRVASIFYRFIPVYLLHSFPEYFVVPSYPLVYRLLQIVSPLLSIELCVFHLLFPSLSLSSVDIFYREIPGQSVCVGCLKNIVRKFHSQSQTENA